MADEREIVGGDGLVDGKTTHGEDIKGNSTVNPVANAPVDEATDNETPAETETPAEDSSEGTEEQAAPETSEDTTAAAPVQADGEGQA
jgi:hypothetical protein